MRERGFTLIELLVVIAVLGVLAAGVFVAINPLKRIGQANDARIKSDIGQISNAMQAYYITHQSYPATVRALVDSGELKTEPKKPGGGIYDIVVTPDGCTTAANDCAEAVVSASLAEPQVPGSSYQWSSTTGVAGEAAPLPTATPVPSATATPAPPTPTPLLACVSNGLIGYWDFNEGAGSEVSDKMGGRSGIWNGTFGSQWVVGKMGTAGSFNGSNNYVEIPPNYNRTTGLSAITVGAWISGTGGRIINRGTNDILFLLSGGKLQVFINNGNPGVSTTNQVVSPNTWTHVAFTWSAGAVSIYVNGTAVPISGSTSGSTISDSGGSNLRFGAYANDGTVERFTGIIDDVRIYNRVLSAPEINSFYNNNFGCKP